MKICFVAQGVYPILSQTSLVEKVGGAELQQAEIGKALSRKGFDISYIVADYGQKDPERIDGLTLHKSFREASGLPGFRFFYPRLFKIWEALRRADADVYYCRAAGFLPGVLAVYCRIYHKKFIFAGAHDTDFIPGKFMIPTLRDKLLYRYGIRHAAAIVVQSHHQRMLLKDNLELEGRVIRNFLGSEASAGPVLRDREYVLWVSTIRHWKRPEHFVRLARQFPEVRFVMIGGPDAFAPELFRAIESECKALPNISFLGFQPLSETEKYFDKAKVFVNTSLHEGFPNTFLQAWRRGIPVISYVDPDDLIKQHKLGIVIADESGLKKALHSFLSDPAWVSGPIVDYFNSNHSAGVIENYTRLLAELSY